MMQSDGIVWDVHLNEEEKKGEKKMQRQHMKGRRTIKRNNVDEEAIGVYKKGLTTKGKKEEKKNGDHRQRFLINLFSCQSLH
jgi:hypothetical protein